MRITAPDMPYGFRDLEPAISRDTLWFHFSRQQQACFEPLRRAVAGTELEPLTLEGIVQATAQAPARRALFRLAAGLWNHSVYWRSMRAGGGGIPYGPIARAIHEAYGSYEEFAFAFKEACRSVYGNGWLWITWRYGRLELLTTVNSETPMLAGHTVLLALDLWEHAYYLDHQNRRSSYVAVFLEDLINWNYANETLELLSDPNPRLL